LKEEMTMEEKLKFQEEQEAGRRAAARGYPPEFNEEEAAGRVDRVRERFELEQEAGRRAAVKSSGGLTGASAT
jgi:hypothetical protein